MKELLETISAFIWDSLNSLCLYFQGTMGNVGLIVWGIIAVIVAAFFAGESCKDENGKDNIWYGLLSIVVFFAVYGSIFCIGWNEFKVYEKANSEYGWFFVSLMLFSSLALFTCCFFNKKVLFSIGFVISVIVSAALFSKFVVVLGILLGLGAFAGGSSYVGTFTDKNGNSYDVFKKN